MGKWEPQIFLINLEKKYWVGLCPLPSKGLIPRVHVSCGTFFILDMSPLADLRGGGATPPLGAQIL